MDVVLERVLSLIPRKPNGKFVHGAKTEFAERIGLNHPQIVSDWASGRSNSYRNYLYQISAAYGVSVEWLRGETDEKTKKAAPEDGDGDAILALLHTLSNDQLLDLQARANELLRERMQQ